MPGKGMTWKEHNFGKGSVLQRARLRQPQFRDRSILRKTRLRTGTILGRAQSWEGHDFSRAI
jgi:hypothetical protein